MKSNVIVVAVACAFATAVTAAPMYTPISSRDLQLHEAFELQGRSPLLGDAELSYPSLMRRADVQPPIEIPMTSLPPADTAGGHTSTPGQPPPHQQMTINTAPQTSNPNDLEAGRANALQHCSTCPRNLKPKDLAVGAVASCLCLGAAGVVGWVAHSEITTGHPPQ